MKTQPKEENKNPKSRTSRTEVQEKAKTQLNITCKAHGEEMVYIGESTRGIPEFYCTKGCKVEGGRGKVKMVKEERGYGFIQVEGGEDVFVHVSEMNGFWPPEEGDLVEFKLGLNPDSGELHAVSVTNLTEAARNTRKDQI